MAEEPESPAVIELDTLSYTVPTEPPTPILRSVSLRIRRGEFVAVIGPSGSGKSTLLNVLGLLDRPTSGRYLLDGSDVGQLDSTAVDRLRADFFGFVFQASHVIGDDSVARNVSLGLRIRGVDHAFRHERSETALDQVGLSHKWGAEGRTLSGGERQRVAIARALAGEPTVILADEPTGNLDSTNSLAVIGLLSDLHARGHTVVVVTHDERVAEAAERRIEVIDGVVQDSAPVGRRAWPASEQSRRQPLSIWGRAGDVVGDALTALAARPFRTLCLVAAFALGAGGLVAASGLSETASAQVSERLAQSAYDEVRSVLPAGTTADQASDFASRIAPLKGSLITAAALTLSASDAKISRLAPTITSDAPVSPGPLYLADPHLLEVAETRSVPAQAQWMLDGSLGSDVVLLGEQLAEDLDVDVAGPGQQVWIQGRPFQVVGIIADSARFPTLTQSAVVPLVAMGMIDVGAEKIRLITRTELGYPAPLAEAIPLALRPDNPGAIATETVADLRLVQRGVRSDLGLYIGVLSALLLVLASLSASTTMYVAVRSRTGEIALRRALGGSGGLIRRMFLVEGVLIGLGGGAAGASMGVAATVAFSWVNGWTPVMSASAPALGIIAGIVTGAIAAAVPAELAARIDPATAIRTSG